MEWSISTVADNKLQQVGYTELYTLMQLALADLAIYGVEFLDNGARFYIDCGSHVEYATPEAISSIEATACEIAGERVVSGIRTAQLGIQGLDIIDNLSINKRVVDDDRNTWGYHENYSAHGLLSISEEDLALLGLHLATRNILFGSGVLLANGSYAISQKSCDIYDNFSYNTTQGKPVVNLRREDLADPTISKRVHVTSGDPNMSPWAMRMKFGTTSLIIALIEHGIKPYSMQFRDQLWRITREISNDLTVSKKYGLHNLTRTSAIEMQQWLLKNIKKLEKEINFTPEDYWTIEQ